MLDFATIHSIKGKYNGFVRSRVFTANICWWGRWWSACGWNGVERRQRCWSDVSTSWAPLVGPHPRVTPWDDGDCQKKSAVFHFLWKSGVLESLRRSSMSDIPIFPWLVLLGFYVGEYWILLLTSLLSSWCFWDAARRPVWNSFDLPSSCLE